MSKSSVGRSAALAEGGSASARKSRMRFMTDSRTCSNQEALAVQRNFGRGSVTTPGRPFLLPGAGAGRCDAAVKEGGARDARGSSRRQGVSIGRVTGGFLVLPGGRSRFYVNS